MKSVNTVHIFVIAIILAALLSIHVCAWLEVDCATASLYFWYHSGMYVHHLIFVPALIIYMSNASGSLVRTRFVVGGLVAIALLIVFYIDYSWSCSQGIVRNEGNKWMLYGIKKIEVNERQALVAMWRGIRAYTSISIGLCIAFFYINIINVLCIPKESAPTKIPWPCGE